jgi:hypothetical protein
VKQYEPYRGPGCPTGRHAEHDPKDGDGRPLGPDEAARLHAFNEVCDCPWLVVTSTTPVHHMTSWTRRELERFIDEADNGYFDPGHYPPRNGKSQFMPPLQQRLLLLLEQGRKLAAVQVLLGELIFDGAAWDPATGCLSLRHHAWTANADHEWLQLWLKGGAEGEREQYTATSHEPGGSPDTIDGLWEESPVEQAQLDEQAALIDGARAQVRELVRGVIKVGDTEMPVELTNVTMQDGFTVAHGAFPSGQPVMVAQREPLDVEEVTMARGGVTDSAAAAAEESQGWVDVPLPLPEITQETR